jgi:hypothetical protein
MLLKRHAATKLAEVAAIYSDVLRGRGQPETALAFMRIAYERDFEGLQGFIGGVHDAVT